MTSLSDKFQNVFCPDCDRNVAVLPRETLCPNCGQKLPVPVPLLDGPERKPDIRVTQQQQQKEQLP